MRNYLFVALAVLMAGASAGAAYDVPADLQPASVEQRIWDELRRSPNGEVTFVVVMREVPGAGPASAVQAQRGLEVPLAAMQRVGTVRDFSAYYGINAIVVTGTSRALQFVAEWPEVAQVRSHEPGEFDLLNAAASAALVPNATGAFTGQVTNLSASPLQGVLVRAYKQTGPTSWLVVGTATTQADGTYSVGGLATGIYRAQFEDLAGNYVPEFYNDKREFFRATNFDVTDGQVTPNINAVLALGGKISGTVSELDSGDPVVDIAVSAWYTSTGSWHAAGTGITNGSGEYLIVGLADGGYRLRFDDIYTVPRYLTEYYDNKATLDEGDEVTVTSGQTTPEINAALGGYGGLEGTVYGEDGVTPLADILVDVYEPDGYGGWQWEGYDRTDGSGQYRVDGLVTRDYRVEYSDALSPEQFASEFYNNKPTVETGDDVHVELGLTTENVDVSLVLTPMTAMYSLVDGWNLVSVSLAPSEPPPTRTLESIAGKYNVIWGYEGCDSLDQWKLYNPSAPPYVNDLDEMTAQGGYWLDMAVSASWQVSGLRALKTDVTLCPGWNLIGYPAGVAKAPAVALAGIAGKYNLVYGYDASDTADPWKKYNPSGPPYANDLTEMRPGFGYWIRMTQAATLTIVSR